MATVSWVQRFKEKYDSCYPGWEPWEPPRDEEHIRLWSLAKDKNRDVLSQRQEKLGPVIPDNHFVTAGTLQRVFSMAGKQYPRIKKAMTGEKLEVYYGSPSVPVDVATFEDMARDDFVEAIGRFCPLAVDIITLDLGPTYVKFVGNSRPTCLWKW